MINFMAWILLGMVLWTSAASHADAETAGSVAPVVGLVQPPSSLNPFAAKTRGDLAFIWYTNYPLASLDESWRQRCFLCAELPSVHMDDESDGAVSAKRRAGPVMTVSWEIAANALWGDGKPVTGEDFRLAWEIALTGPKDTYAYSVYSPIASITVDSKNPKAFMAKYREIRHDFHELGSLFPVPSHLEGKIWVNSGSQWDTYLLTSTYTLTPTHSGLYTGPFRVVQRTSSGNLVLSANEKCVLGRAGIPLLSMRFFEREEALTAALNAGTVDLVPEGTFDYEFLKKLRLQLENGIQTHNRYRFVMGPGLVFEHVDINLRNPLFLDVNVRRALVLGLHRDQLVKELFEGDTKVAHSFMHPGDPSAQLRADERGFNRDEAINLLTDAGWQKNRADIWEKDGRELAFSLAYAKGQFARETVARRLAEDWKALGIRVTLQPETSEVFFQELLRRARYTGLALYAWVAKPLQVPKSAFYSREVPTVQNSYRGQNSSGWISRPADDAIEQLPREPDGSKRIRLIEQVQAAYKDQIPSIPLYFRPEGALVSRTFGGFEPKSFHVPSSLGAQRWSAPKKLGISQPVNSEPAKI